MFILRPGDALSFDSSEPHLLVNEGSEPACGVWFVLGRRLTPESHAARFASAAEVSMARVQHHQAGRTFAPRQRTDPDATP